MGFPTDRMSFAELHKINLEIEVLEEASYVSFKIMVTGLVITKHFLILPRINRYIDISACELNALLHLL